MTKILCVFGTRPEAIKMCPLIKELESREDMRVAVCVTGQHREMLDPVLGEFRVKAKYDLDVMRASRGLADITSRVLLGITEILSVESYDLLLVHGDTASAFAAALAGFYLRVPVGHVEAGLRSGDLKSPFPEELNRRGISLAATLHFAPTETAKRALLAEGIEEGRIYVTGNTAIDALRYTVRKDFSHSVLEQAGNRRLIVFTAHRRESLGTPLEQMLCALRELALTNEDIFVYFPMHKNPTVRASVARVLGERTERVCLCEPADAHVFHNILARAYLVLTDSGGIQEEAAALRVPTLVMRDRTERGEGIECGVLKLVGTRRTDIVRAAEELLGDRQKRDKMAAAPCPFGDGKASGRIADAISEWRAREI